MASRCPGVGKGGRLNGVLEASEGPPNRGSASSTRLNPLIPSLDRIGVTEAQRIGLGDARGFSLEHLAGRVPSEGASRENRRNMR